jgi:hypothetical protein
MPPCAGQVTAFAPWHGKFPRFSAASECVTSQSPTSVYCQPSDARRSASQLTLTSANFHTLPSPRFRGAHAVHVRHGELRYQLIAAAIYLRLRLRFPPFTSATSFYILHSSFCIPHQPPPSPPSGFSPQLSSLPISCPRLTAVFYLLAPYP